jgi:hypothetical protein
MKKTTVVIALLASAFFSIDGIVYAAEVDDFNASSTPKLKIIKITPLATNPSSCDMSALKNIEGTTIESSIVKNLNACIDKPCQSTYSNGTKIKYSIDSAKSSVSHTLDGRHSTPHFVIPSTINDVSFDCEQTYTLNINKNNKASYSDVKFIFSRGDCSYSVDVLPNLAHMNVELHGNKVLKLKDDLRKQATF